MRLAGNSWRAALTATPTGPQVFDRSCAGGILIADRQTGCPMKRNARASSLLGLSLLNFASGQGAYPHAPAANPYTLLEPIQFFPGAGARDGVVRGEVPLAGMADPIGTLALTAPSLPVSRSALITVVAVGGVPPRPAPNLCWYWADPYGHRGYWDYCY